MQFFQDDEDCKKQIAHDITWNEDWIKALEGFPASDSREDAIKKHRQFATHARQVYAQRYGRAGLAVIRGGRCTLNS